MIKLRRDEMHEFDARTKWTNLRDVQSGGNIIIIM